MRLNPYLHFDGNAEEALNFYKNALGAEVIALSRHGENPMPCDEDWKTKIMHSRLLFDGNLIMISDMYKGTEVKKEGNIQLSIEVESVDKINELFAKMAEGGTIIMELQDTFWGARFGMIKDKFGIDWMFNHELKK